MFMCAIGRGGRTCSCVLFILVISIHLYIRLQWANIINSGVIVLVITTFVKSYSGLPTSNALYRHSIM